MGLIPRNWWTACLTNIKLPPRTPRRIGSGRRPQGRSRRRGPEGTTPSRHSSPRAFPSPSTPTRSARTCSTVKKKMGQPDPTHFILPLVPVNWLLWTGPLRKNRLPKWSKFSFNSLGAIRSSDCYSSPERERIIVAISLPLKSALHSTRQALQRVRSNSYKKDSTS